MKITHGGQTIDPFADGKPKKQQYHIGGATASLLYLVTKHFPEIEIIPNL